SAPRRAVTSRETTTSASSTARSELSSQITSPSARCARKVTAPLPSRSASRAASATSSASSAIANTPSPTSSSGARPSTARAAGAHIHPEMEERYEVVSGTAAFRTGEAEEQTAGPGEVVVVPPGTRHLAWNPTDAPVHLRIEMRPALRWAQFVERLFAGEDPV